MSCELCHRSSCTRCFHSLEEQEEFDTKTGQYAPERPLPEARRCGTCRWIVEFSKGSENTYFACGFPRDNVPRPYQAAMGLLYARNPQYHHLSVGDPESDYGSNCPTWTPTPD